MKEDIDNGSTLVRQLDRDGFPFTAALWNYDSESQKWSLVIATPIVAKNGPKEAYRRLVESLKRMKKLAHGAYPLDTSTIEVVKETDDLIKALRRAVRTGKKIAGIRFSRNYVNGTYIEDAYIYRST